MTMSTALARCLSKTQSRFETVHRHGSPDGTAPARPVSIPGDRLARTVLLEDNRGYLAAVIPATHHLKLSEICEQTGRQLARARAEGVHEVFRDCDPGALPPVGMAYGTQTWLDDSLMTHPDVYFEAGDREAVVHMSTEQFATLMAGARRGHFAHRRL